LLLHHTAPDVVQTEACFQQALTIARHQHATSWELRAALSLSRLWQRQGKHQEAYGDATAGSGSLAKIPEPAPTVTQGKQECCASTGTGGNSARLAS
jgi:predicted ATPase